MKFYMVLFHDNARLSKQDTFVCMYVYFSFNSVLFTRCESHVYLQSSIIIWVKGTLGKGWRLSGLKYETKNVLVISRGVKNKTMYSNNSQIYTKIEIRRIWRGSMRRGQQMQVRTENS